MIFKLRDFCIDFVEDKDINAIVEVYNSNKCFLVNHMGTDKVRYEWVLEELENMRKAGFYSCKVVEKSSGKVMGIIDFKIGEETYLSLLMIHDNYKNKGLGKLIYQALEEYAKKVKSKSMRIDVVTNYDNAVLNFWVKNGFDKIKDVELEWAGKILPAVIMKKNI
ncbi:GNAT family N-acetyltransferase [Clostridium estertheticum]|uniref:GNAT family N-acetyltransferase n=1 Tax=Clostridium estertheticum TaxID=238834 RepID=UPI001C7D048E|nr:GNAT family N-acetyltransferase [Clostridium estertheticum]MBX4262134.1 GNAT family N-acetyltransferase [Clostridium estertheticum]WLC69005.1 GNAT family N-acetyltransferase [Clostridium estertheticum]